MHCWWECRLVQPLWKAVWSYLKKLKMELPYDPEISVLGISEEIQNTNTKEYMNPYTHCSVIYNHQDMGAAKVSINRRVDKTTMGHLHNGILLVCENKENFTLCNSMDGPGEHYAK